MENRKSIISLLLTLSLCVGLFAMLGGTASAATLQERQQAVVTVAWAYYDKGHSAQYDGTALNDNAFRDDGGKLRSTNQVAPEYATPHETMFTVCSDFAHQVYWETFRYSILQYAGACWTGALLAIPKDDPMTVWYWDSETGQDAGAGITQMLSLCQPGDLITADFASGGGHTMIYVGDVLGDGKAYLLHSGGSHMDVATKKDTREYKTNDDPEMDDRYGKAVNPDSNGGTIKLSEADSFLRGRYEPKGKLGKMNLLRPLNSVSDSEYPITAATKFRMSHPRLAIDRMLNKTRFNSAFPGETVTMTLKLTNNSEKDYTVPVTEKAPTGAKLKTPFAGANVSGDTMKLDVALKAGESKTLTAEFEITAKRGEKVVFDGGSVGDIPSNVIPITVGGAKLTEEENAKLLAAGKGEYAKLLTDAKANNSTLGNLVYQKVLGLNVKLPEYKWIAKNCFKQQTTRSGAKEKVFLTPDEIPAEKLESYQFIVPTFWGGFSVWYEWGIERCSDLRDMHLEPGDVIIRSENLITPTTSEQMVYCGDGKYLMYDQSKKSLRAADETEFFKSITYKVFFVLRPTLAYDDVHTLPPLPKEFKFTDVKEGDWFYTYVKDLVMDGTVNGMTETTFVPNGNLTYGQALKLITLAVGEKEQEKTGTHWASGYLTLAKSKGWLGEDVDLDGKVTRLAFCKIAAKAKGLTEQPASNPFKDTSDPDVLALNKAGVINGMSATEFKPDGLLTRAQISKIIWTLRKV